MIVDKDLISKVSRIARLNLSEDEIEEFTPQIKEVLDNFSKIAEVNTEDIKPAFSPIEIKDALREDEIKESLSNSDALKLSPHNEEGFIKGPRVV